MLSVMEAPVATDSDRRDEDVIAAVMLRHGERVTMCAPARSGDPRITTWLRSAIVTVAAPLALLTLMDLAALG